MKNRNAEYPKEIMDLINNRKYQGRITHSSSSSYIKGPCGDAMEFHLVIEEERIIEIKYWTDGCWASNACATMTAKLAEGKTLKEALSISAGEILKNLNNLPEGHLHCAILSVSTLYKAIADYLLNKNQTRNETFVNLGR